MSWYWVYHPSHLAFAPYGVPPPPQPTEAKSSIPRPTPEAINLVQLEANHHIPPPQQQPIYYTYPQAPPPVYHPGGYHHVQQPQYVIQSPYAQPAQTTEPLKGKPKSPPTKFHYVPAGQVPNAESKGKNVWYGRSREQVATDNHTIGLKGGYKEHEIAPHKPKDDQMFKVIEPDGGETWRTARTCEGFEGHWIEGPGKQLIFVRHGCDEDEDEDS